MKANAPKKLTIFIALILAIVAVVTHFVPILFITPYAFWVLLVGFCLLLGGCIFKNL